MSHTVTAQDKGDEFVVCALYKFVTLENYQALREPLQTMLEAAQIRGTLLLASEGINGTVAGSRQAIAQLKAWLPTMRAFTALITKNPSVASSLFIVLR